jgi:hypothetical protein
MLGAHIPSRLQLAAVHLLFVARVPVPLDTADEQERVV